MMGKSGVYFKPQTSIFTYVLINKSIDLSIGGQKGGRYTPVGNQTVGYIDRIGMKYASSGQTVARTDRTQY